jgi:uncharacterized protein YlxW (UPF0749 family)
MTPSETFLTDTGLTITKWNEIAATRRFLSNLKPQQTSKMIETLREENGNLRITVQTQAELIAEYEYKLNEVSAVAVTYANAIGEYHAKAERYRLAMLQVLGAGDLATAVEAVQEALGHE